MKQIKAKSIIYPVKSNGWFDYQYNMNIYRGCSFGCIYCDSRSDCYHVEDFDTVRYKEHALSIIQNDLRNKNSKGVIGTGAMSDPYNPLEKTLKLTRHALELISAYGYGIGIDTKSDLVTRDIDVLKEIQVNAPVIVEITITTPHDALSLILEPHASPSSQRFEAIKQLSDAGIYCGVLLMPVLPFIEDSVEDILLLVDLAHQAGAKFIYPYFGVTLRSNQRDHFYKQLDRLFPGLSNTYRKTYHQQYSCVSLKEHELMRAFKQRCHDYGILYDLSQINRAFRKGYYFQQMNLFDDFD